METRWKITPGITARSPALDENAGTDGPAGDRRTRLGSSTIRSPRLSDAEVARLEEAAADVDAATSALEQVQAERDRVAGELDAVRVGTAQRQARREGLEAARPQASDAADVGPA
jgi:hypothetical protein